MDDFTGNNQEIGPLPEGSSSERLERKEIDVQFAAMAEDTTYQSLILEIELEFAESDWEALETGEAIHLK